MVDRSRLLADDDTLVTQGLLLEKYILKYFKSIPPELQALKGCKQSPRYHKEGDAWRHTELVLWWALQYADVLHQRAADVLILAAILHDVGKPVVTDEKGRAIGHAKVGAEIAEQLLEKYMLLDRDDIKRVVKMVRLHMKPLMYHATGARESKWNRLLAEIDLAGLRTLFMMLVTADIKGREGSRSEDLEAVRRLL